MPPKVRIKVRVLVHPSAATTQRWRETHPPQPGKMPPPLPAELMALEMEVEAKTTEPQLKVR